MRGGKAHGSSPDTINFMKRMSMKQFGEVVRKSVDLLSEKIKRHLENVVIDIENAPTDDFLREAGYTDEEIESGEMPYGYFIPMQGVSATEMLEDPNRILIFKFPLEEDFPDPDELMLEIRKTVVHEIAHHFGWSERDLQKFEDDPNPFGNG
jgi:predicted Zn-dependent protease with MMP-like domain